MGCNKHHTFTKKMSKSINITFIGQDRKVKTKWRFSHLYETFVSTLNLRLCTCTREILISAHLSQGSNVVKPSNMLMKCAEVHKKEMYEL